MSLPMRGAMAWNARLPCRCVRSALRPARRRVAWVGRFARRAPPFGSFRRRAEAARAKWFSGEVAGHPVARGDLPQRWVVLRTTRELAALGGERAARMEAAAGRRPRR